MTRKRKTESEHSRGGKKKMGPELEITGVKGENHSIRDSVVVGENKGTISVTSTGVQHRLGCSDSEGGIATMTRKRKTESEHSRGGKKKMGPELEITGVKGENHSLRDSVVVGENKGTINLTSTGVQHRLDTDYQRIRDFTEGMVKTETFDNIMKAIENGQKIFVITGDPGEGKTILGYLILRAMWEKGMAVFPVTSLEKYKQTKIHTGTVIMFDDIFGSIAFEIEKYSKWEDTFIDLLALPEHGGSHSGTNTILIILRKTILRQVKTKLDKYAIIFEDKDIMIDLSGNLCLTESDKRKVLKVHLDRIDLHESEDDINFVCSKQMTFGFPQCCKMYVKIGKKNIREFFDRPQKFLDSVTQSLIEREHVREVLEIMIRKGNFEESEVHDDKKRQRLIAATRDIPYLRMEGGCYIFDHSSYQESVWITIGREDPTFIIRRCSMSCIKQYMTESTSTDQDRALFTNLSDELKDKLLSMIAEELCKADYDYLKFDLLTNKDNITNVLNNMKVHSGHSEGSVTNRKDKQQKTIWMYAVAAKNLPAFEVLIAEGADVNAIVYGQTMLHYICKNKFLDGAKCIIDKVNDIDAIDNLNRPALYYACESSPSEELITFLINKGAKINSPEISPMLIRNLCKKGNQDLADTILERITVTDLKEKLTRAKKVYLTKKVNDSLDKLILLHYYCHYKELNGVMTLLKTTTQFDINEPFFHSCAIHEACKGPINADKSEIVKLLVNHNADVNITDSDGMTALHLLCESGCLKGVREIRDKVTTETVNRKDKVFDFTPFLFFCVTPEREDSLEMLQLLLECGADVNVDQADGMHGLHYLCANNNYRCLEHLFINGKVKDVNVCVKKDIADHSVRGQTPLHFLCNTDATEASVKLLLDHKADIYRTDSKGKTPLDYLKQDPLKDVFRTRNMFFTPPPLSSRKKEERKKERSNAVQLMERSCDSEFFSRVSEESL